MHLYRKHQVSILDHSTLVYFGDHFSLDGHHHSIHFVSHHLKLKGLNSFVELAHNPFQLSHFVPKTNTSNRTIRLQKKQL